MLVTTSHHSLPARIAILVTIAFCAFASVIACRPRTLREKLLERDRERLLDLIKQDQAVRSRFAAIKPGTSRTDVVNQLGKSTMTAPCSNATECWYYDISGHKYFVCFDQHDAVVCQGSAQIFRQRADQAPPNSR